MRDEIVFISDCEGPISKNDNAFEFTSSIIPNGDHLFSLLSKYDDVLAYLSCQQGYRAGSTLKLVSPFLKAYGASNRRLEKFSRETLMLMPGAKETLQQARTIAPSYIVSTSYQQYVSVVCEHTGFPPENARCTIMNLDKHRISEEDRKIIRLYADEICALPMIEIPIEARTAEDLTERDRQTVKALDRIFWKVLAETKAGRIMRDVTPMGGIGKVEAVREILRELGRELREVIYVGDSITDREAMASVKEAGGLAISFNGNAHAVRNANLAIMSRNTLPVSAILDAISSGRTLKSPVSGWTENGLSDLLSDDNLREKVKRAFDESSARMVELTRSNVEKTSKESEAFRKKVRGEAVGKLG